MPVKAVDLGQVSSHVLGRRVRLLFRKREIPETFTALTHTHVQLSVAQVKSVVRSLFCPKSGRLHRGWTPAGTGSSCSTSPATPRLETRGGDKYKQV